MNATIANLKYEFQNVGYKITNTTSTGFQISGFNRTYTINVSAEITYFCNTLRNFCTYEQILEWARTLEFEAIQKMDEALVGKTTKEEYYNILYRFGFNDLFIGPESRKCFAKHLHKLFDLCGITEIEEFYTPGNDHAGCSGRYYGNLISVWFSDRFVGFGNNFHGFLPKLEKLRKDAEAKESRISQYKLDLEELLNSIEAQEVLLTDTIKRCKETNDDDLFDILVASQTNIREKINHLMDQCNTLRLTISKESGH